MPNGESAPAGRRAAVPHLSPVMQTAADSREPEPLRAVTSALSEVCEHLRQLAQVRTDQVRLAVRSRVQRLLLRVAAGLLAFLVALIALAYAIHGAALGLAVACGDRLWLGYLLAGVLFLTASVMSLAVMGLRARIIARRRLVRKYGRAARQTPRENNHAVVANR